MKCQRSTRNTRYLPATHGPYNDCKGIATNSYFWIRYKVGVKNGRWLTFNRGYNTFCGTNNTAEETCP